MVSKDVPQKMQFLGAIKKVASPWRKNSTYSAATEAK